MAANIFLSIIRYTSFVSVKGNWSVLEPETKAVTLRLSEQDIAKAKARARKLGTPYQTLLKGFIHQALS